MKYIATFLISLCLTTNVAIADEKAKARELDALAHAGLGSVGFYHAKTEAENTLARILFITDNDKEFIAFALKRPWLSNYGRSRLSVFFSLSLQNAWAYAEAEEVKENCDGAYIEGERCGLGSNPLTCAQDYNEEGYLYKTLAEDDEVAIISYMWPHIPETAATFRMIRQKGQWIVDGVSCGSIINPTYNFKF
jgi:hypothetical protein